MRQWFLSCLNRKRLGFKLLAFSFFFLLLTGSVEASPKYVTVSVDALPSHISVETSKLGDENQPWYGFSLRVNLKHPSSSSVDLWSAQLAISDNEGNYRLTAPLQPAKTTERISFWVTVELSLLKNAVIQLRDSNFIVYEIKLWTSKGVPK